jgi:hypothetical protein
MLDGACHDATRSRVGSASRRGARRFWSRPPAVDASATGDDGGSVTVKRAATARERHHSAASPASTRMPHARLARSSPREIARRTDRGSTRRRSAMSFGRSTAVGGRSSKGVSSLGTRSIPEKLSRAPWRRSAFNPRRPCRRDPPRPCRRAGRPAVRRTHVDPEWTHTALGRSRSRRLREHETPP